MSCAKKVFFAVLFFFSMPVFATTIHYQGEMDKTIWQTKLQFDRCEIYTEIQQQGLKVSFIVTPGEALSLSVYSGIHSSMDLEQSFAEVINAPWKHGKLPAQRQIMAESITGNEINFQQGVEDLFQKMLAGYWLQVNSMSDLGVNYIVSIPTIFLHKETRSFNQCISKLPTINYDKINRLAFNYRENQYQPNEKQTENLIKISDYIKKDSSVVKILIDGHSDNTGNSGQNVRLSKLRADEIAQVLINNAISPDLIEIRGHGGRYPVANNNSPEGREKNRRVSIRLVKVNAKTKASDSIME